MKKRQPIILSLLIFLFHYTSYGQTLSRQVRDFIVIEDSIVAVTNVTIIDGTSRATKYNQDIVWINNHIKAIGNSGKVEIQEGAKIIDGTGKTIIPGLIMMHEHLFYAKPFDGKFKAVHMTHTFPKMYLAGGVTTMRTAGSLEANADLNIKNLIDAGKILGPSIDVSTPHVEREIRIPQVQSLYGSESIENWLEYWFGKGATSVKVYNNISKEDLRRIVNYSHAKGIKLTVHLCSITYKESSEIGIDNIEHSFMASTDFAKNKQEDQCVNGASSLYDIDENNKKFMELARLLIKKNVTLTYTPTVFEPYSKREVVPGGGSVALAPYLLKQMQSTYDQMSNTKRDSLSLMSFKREMKRVFKFHSLGGKLTVGTDPTGAGKTIAGYSNQRLIELLVDTGFSIEEAIKLATLNGAKYLDIEGKTGTVEVGKAADLVLIDGDISRNVSDIRKMEIVFKNGIGFDSKKIFDSVRGKVGLY